ncbi:MAG: Acetyltransferase [Adhaeribacter sp.]|nr:Acetyltransferase [Adhaeribacter sp.]
MPKPFRQMQEEIIQSKYVFRTVSTGDIPYLLNLYRQVALAGGLGRSADEINIAYIQDFVTQSQARGIILALHPSSDKNLLVGEIHGYTLGLHTFAHVFEQVTMVVHPDYQGAGLGKLLLNKLQTQIRENMPAIKKVELMCFGNNQPALNLYLHNGFEVEGCRKNRVRLPDGTFTNGLALGWFNPAYTK